MSYQQGPLWFLGLPHAFWDTAGGSEATRSVSLTLTSENKTALISSSPASDDKALTKFNIRAESNKSKSGKNGKGENGRGGGPSLGPGTGAGGGSGRRVYRKLGKHVRPAQAERCKMSPVSARLPALPA